MSTLDKLMDIYLSEKKTGVMCAVVEYCIGLASDDEDYEGIEASEETAAEYIALRTRLAEQEARIEKLEDFIRGKEYEYDYNRDEWTCLSCKKMQDQEHDKDCELNNLLNESEKK